MLLAEVAPMSSTHSASSEFSSREISPMPLDRRVSFCWAAAPAVWFEEFRKNLITCQKQMPSMNAPGRAISPPFLRRRGHRRLPGLFLNINLAFQERALFNGDALRGHVAGYDRRPDHAPHRPCRGRVRSEKHTAELH